MRKRGHVTIHPVIEWIRGGVPSSGRVVGHILVPFLSILILTPYKIPLDTPDCCKRPGQMGCINIGMCGLNFSVRFGLTFFRHWIARYKSYLQAKEARRSEQRPDIYWSTVRELERKRGSKLA